MNKNELLDYMAELLDEYTTLVKQVRRPSWNSTRFDEAVTRATKE
jgi:hypothetical protein